MTKSKFVIMHHKALRAGDHYDLRFKKPNSKLWVSFAVRKGVPIKPGQKVLAAKTRDHTEKDALFTGTIKSGEYGAGTLKRWDGGICIIHKYKTSSMTIEFRGSKIKGVYHLVSTGVIDKDFKKQTYMLFKGKSI